MKKLLLLLTLCAIGFNVQAQQTASVSPTTASTNNILTNASRLLSVTIANSSATDALTVRLFDAGYNGATALTYTLAAYTNTITYATNIVTSYVTTTGVTNSLTNAGIFTVVNTVAASTNSFPTVNLITVPPTNTVIWAPSGGYLTSRGLVSTNNTNCTITVSYTPAF